MFPELGAWREKRFASEANMFESPWKHPQDGHARDGPLPQGNRVSKGQAAGQGSCQVQSRRGGKKKKDACRLARTALGGHIFRPDRALGSPSHLFNVLDTYLPNQQMPPRKSGYHSVRCRQRHLA
ncbi:hypothetical protein LX36DRAFT_384039 [Colletotrichum falcatum]|nr:hypothetical protein LX36DRAFT_384039 [Colletotrichum falcatum]